MSNNDARDDFLWLIGLCTTVFFSGFVVGSSCEQWTNHRLSNQCDVDPESLEPYPDPISGGIQPENL